MAGKAFTLSHARNNPLIYSGCALKRKKANNTWICIYPRPQKFVIDNIYEFKLGFTLAKGIQYASGGGSDGHIGGGPGLTRTSTATSDKDRGLADSAAVHIKWDRDGGIGMALRPLRVVWHRAPRPPYTLRRMPSQVCDESRP